MNCTFCKSKLEVFNSIYYKCNPCNIEYFYDGVEPQEIVFIIFKLDCYEIELDTSYGRCRLYRTNMPPNQNHKLIMALDHYPNITPDNSKYWLDKLLNLKAFS